uniref:Uncharacterized protein n=1 Tax=Heterorhabditis bacteriophora TaxID=37862 RepID=A0A1I7WZI4_HETBA
MANIYNFRYNERMYGSAANAGSQFDYVHGMDENNFQLLSSIIYVCILAGVVVEYCIFSTIF